MYSMHKKHLLWLICGIYATALYTSDAAVPGNTIPLTLRISKGRASIVANKELTAEEREWHDKLIQLRSLTPHNSPNSGIITGFMWRVHSEAFLNIKDEKEGLKRHIPDFE